MLMRSLLLLAIVVFFAVSISPAYAQHHSGSLAPPVDFDGMAVALSSILSPDDFTYEEDGDTANLAIRFFDSESNVTINSVTYRVQIFQGENLVANEYFYDEDGKLDLEIRPTTGCQDQDLWKCTKYFGEKHPIAGAYFARGDSHPVIQGPVFDKGGQYNVKVSIVGATNPKTMTTSDLHFETFLSIPQNQIFMIQTANAEEFPISIKSFDSEIMNFSFDEESNKISYEVPFDSNHNQQHGYITKHNIYLQKDFSVFKEGYDVDVYLEGIKLEKKFLLDTLSLDENIIKLEIAHEDILSIQEQTEETSDTIMISVLSGKQTNVQQLDFMFENGNTAKVTWDGEMKSGQEIPFTFSFFNADGTKSKDVLYAYNIADLSGNEIWSNIGTSQTHLGILVPDGRYQESILIPNDGEYQLKVILTGQGAENYKEFFTSKAEFNISSQFQKDEIKNTNIPVWIKNGAGWWADGIVGDTEFIQSIQFLINEGILSIPDTENKTAESGEVPEWVKNNAGWWAEDLISDDDFMKGIQFLVEQGIVSIN